MRRYPAKRFVATRLIGRLFLLKPFGGAGESRESGANLDQYSMARSGRDESFVGIGTEFALIDYLDAPLLELIKSCFGVWHIERQVMNSFAVPVEKAVQEGVLPQRLEQFQSESREVE